MKQKILSLLVLLIAVSSAWAKTYTTFQLGDVIKLGDQFAPTVNWQIKIEGAGGDWLQSGKTYTLKRAKVNGPVSVDENGNKYAFVNDNDASEILVLFDVTETSDGAEVKAVSETPSFTVGVHEVTIDPNAVEVTTNATSEGDYFTEASFNMPAYDATVGFEMVRDMAQQMTTKVGDAAAGADYRIRLRKNGTAWELADITHEALMALITVTDGIEDKTLACFGQSAVCDLEIYALDDNDQPTGTAISFANLEPGRYKAKAVAKADGYYIGETALSNVIVLFQGYEVKVPAKEMITYYKDENLYADQETSADAQLYTVSDVSGTTVTLSGAITIVPAYTAMLVYNPTDLDKTFLLIPTEEQADNIGDIYAGFKGTLEATTIAASTVNKTNFALNGKQFVYVMKSIPVAANKAWLEVNPVGAPNRLTIVFGEEGTTDISEYSEAPEYSDGAWYDLSGRKLDGEPTEPGVYIKDGKKVVVK